jgi:hypothetical protein
MSETKQVIQCLVCAWRENCQKKYSVEARPGWRCPEFERDLTIKDKPEEAPEKAK